MAGAARSPLGLSMATSIFTVVPVDASCAATSDSTAAISSGDSTLGSTSPSRPGRSTASRSSAMRWWPMALMRT